MSRELRKQALEALESANEALKEERIACLDVRQAIKDIKSELAKPEPEPVAWQNKNKLSEFYENDQLDPMWESEFYPLYREPPARKPLSEDDIISLGFKAGFAIDTIEDGETGEEHYGFLNDEGEVSNAEFFKFVRLIEKAHGIG